MADLFNSAPAELQNMRIETIAMLRESFLQEEIKKNLMQIMPYLPLVRLKPIYRKLSEEQKIRHRTHSVAAKKVKEMKAAISKIKREAWKQAELEYTSNSKILDQNFSDQLTQA